MENLYIGSKKYEEVINEIKSFIELRKEPKKCIGGYVLEINHFEKSIVVELQRDSYFYKGALVLVNNEQGSVVDSYGSKVKIEFKKDPSKFQDESVVVDTSLTNIALERLEKTINKIEDANLDEKSQKILDSIMGIIIPEYNNESVDFVSRTLNTSQAEAISRAIQAEDFHLIIGPPGTGKTYVINEIIRQLTRKRKRILLTAWTNIAVDNILERIPELEDKILRIGSDISAPNLKYSLQERRKNHEDWAGIERLDNLIEVAFEDIKSLRKQSYEVQDAIVGIKNKRKEYESSLNNLLNVKSKYSKIVESYNQNFDYNTDEFFDVKNKKESLERDAGIYYSISQGILEVENVNSTLPDTELFYKLESEIKGMNHKRLIKRILSIFNKNAYQQFLNELNDKETVYNKMKDAYNNYWDLYDSVKEKYDEIYPSEEGNPDLDALSAEVKLFKQLEQFIPLMNHDIKNELNKNENKIIFEAYNQYLVTVGKKIELLRTEIKDLNILMHLKINKKQKISKEINNIQESIEKYKEDKKNLIKVIDSEIIEKAEIIAATVISSANYILDDIQFDCVIMDEASQVASFMSLLPLLKCKKFVLVGDDKQLQPIEESKLSKELNLSIFNRLIEKYEGSSTFLDTQYRMNKQIADIASELFYGGKLKTFDAIADQCIECELDSDIFNSKTPLTYIDTAHFDYYEEGIGSGCENKKEAQFVAQITDKFLKGGINPEEIGIITPYKKHKANITNYLDNEEIEVDTVYRFQGKEKDIIIMSFCNSKLGKLSPFIKKFIEQPTQVNVAITRAKKKFVLVGDSRTLKQSQLLRNVIEIMNEVN